MPSLAAAPCRQLPDCCLTPSTLPCPCFYVQCRSPRSRSCPSTAPPSCPLRCWCECRLARPQRSHSAAAAQPQCPCRRHLNSVPRCSCTPLGACEPTEQVAHAPSSLAQLKPWRLLIPAHAHTRSVPPIAHLSRDSSVTACRPPILYAKSTRILVPGVCTCTRVSCQQRSYAGCHSGYGSSAAQPHRAAFYVKH